MTPFAAVTLRLRESRALWMGLVIGVGLTCRALLGRAVRKQPSGLVDWPRAERLAARRLRAARGSLPRSELSAAAPAYRDTMAVVVPALERRLRTTLPGVVERADVVDRAGWARANLGTFKILAGHLEEQLLPSGASPGIGFGVAAANRFLTTRQVAFLLGYLGTRVLGQYDVAILSAEQAPGRILFVEENIRQTAASLRIPLDHFRTWICLHETTHAFELEAHPWLRPYLRGRLERQLALFVEEARRFQAHGLRHVARRWRAAAAEGSLSALLGPEQRRLFRETQLVMSLMEGFSDWVMDDVGADLVPDVAALRQRFEARRGQRHGTIDRVIGRLIGLDLKLDQYRRGERFVAGVWQVAGEAGIAHLWDGPDSLPRESEMEDPAGWVRRVVPEAMAGSRA